MPSLSEVLKLDPVSAAGDTASYLARIDPVFTIGPKVHGGTLQALSAEAAVRAYLDLAGEAEAAGSAGGSPSRRRRRWPSPPTTWALRTRPRSW